MRKTRGAAAAGWEWARPQCEDKALIDIAVRAASHTSHAVYMHVLTQLKNKFQTEPKPVHKSEYPRSQGNAPSFLNKNS